MPTDTEPSRSRYVNALIGAIVTVVLGFVPLSPVLGGAVAGYLQGDDESEGLWVGAIAGLFALVPITLFSILGIGFFAAMPGGFGFMEALVILFITFFAVVVIGGLYVVALSALGGWIGAKLAENGDESEPSEPDEPFEADETEESGDGGASGGSDSPATASTADS